MVPVIITNVPPPIGPLVREIGVDARVGAGAVGGVGAAQAKVTD